eukprot:5803261-Pyramimonas_sp.AAC.1
MVAPFQRAPCDCKLSSAMASSDCDSGRACLAEREDKLRLQFWARLLGKARKGAQIAIRGAPARESAETSSDCNCGCAYSGKSGNELRL